MEKMRKIRLWIMVMLLTLTVTGCSEAGESSEKELMSNLENGKNETESGTEQAVQHLLEVWSDYLQTLDQMYASQLWAMDYVDAYLESGSWEDLGKARTACITSAGSLEELAMTEEDLTEEEYLTLAEAGIDTEYQSLAFSGLPDELDDAHLVIRERLLESLESDVFYKDAVEMLEEEVSVQRKKIACMEDYACAMTNYLLLTVQDYTDEKSYWNTVQKEYPALTADGPEWKKTEAEVLEAGDSSLDAYEEISLEHAELLSRMEANLYETKQKGQSGEEALEEAAFLIQDTPDFLPAPEWYDSAQAGYASFRKGKDGSLIYPEFGDALEGDGFGVYMQMEGISREETVAYMAAAEQYADTVKEEEDVWQIIMPGYEVQVEWEDQVVTVIFYGEDVTFVPEWYLST